MSRIGKRPIQLPSGVTVTTDEGGRVVVKGPKGALQRQLNPQIVLRQEGEVLHVERPEDTKTLRALHGLTRTLVANMVDGVTAGYRKELEIQGVGYRAQMDGQALVLALGYSHNVEVAPRDGIEYSVTIDPQTRNSIISITGIDKERVGQTAAEIRKLRKPEPYKGKGIRYRGEVVRRKVGKSAVKK